MEYGGRCRVVGEKERERKKEKERNKGWGEMMRDPNIGHQKRFFSSVLFFLERCFPVCHRECDEKTEKYLFTFIKAISR